MAQPYWNHPLPTKYNWGPASFDALADYAAQQHAAYDRAQPTGVLRVASVIATYSTTAQKQACINGALPQDRAQYASSVVVSSATRYYPVGQGGIGMVVSPLQTAAQSSATGANEWHTVGVMRRGNTVWVHDPAYVMGSQARLTLIPGTANVTRLLDSSGFGYVNQVQVWGFGNVEQDCMGRSAQWVDNVLGAQGATAPYAANTFVPGQVTPGWQVVLRQ